MIVPSRRNLFENLFECNDKYVQGEVPCEEEARNKHSCQFHRDETITGVSNGESSQLPNLGDCPNLIRQDQKRRDWDPENRTFVELPYTYYETTWRIRSAEDDREANHGLFWKWFHANFQKEILAHHGRTSWAVKLPDPDVENAETGKSLYQEARDELNTWVRQDG